MTISKGAPWGSEVRRPVGVRIADSDARLARLLTDGSDVPVAVGGGDMFRTLGARPIGTRSEVMALPIDLVRVTLDGDRHHVFVAHLLARSPRRRGGWWTGDALAVMNAEFVGDFDVAPRGHPNDGRVETLRATADLPVRQRIEFRRRLRSATHLPHPGIATRSIRSGSFEMTRPLRVVLDGVDVGEARHIAVEVMADAAVIHA